MDFYASNGVGGNRLASGRGAGELMAEELACWSEERREGQLLPFWTCAANAEHF